MFMRKKKLRHRQIMCFEIVGYHCRWFGKPAREASELEMIGLYSEQIRAMYANDFR